MGASRKLQGEIDRVLKKVQEGVDVFDSIWNKVYDTENLNQKEKFEADLKKEIKKLQRYRDQIKTWIQSSEIKDKKVSASYEQALMDARKQIEREMERFKICEKETKTKAFSKEGLGQQPKTDPKEKAKSETRDWLNNVVGDLTTQIESFEADIEAVSVKKGKSRPPRLANLETSVVRHKAHIMKLELILRLLDNDELSPEQVNDVKDFLEDYVERNQDDFDEFSDVDEFYVALPLEKVESLEELVVSGSSALAKGVGSISTASAGLVLKGSLASSPTQGLAALASPSQHSNSAQDPSEEIASQESNTDVILKTPPTKTGTTSLVSSTSASITSGSNGNTTLAAASSSITSSNLIGDTPATSVISGTSGRSVLDNSLSNASPVVSYSNSVKNDDHTNLLAHRSSPAPGEIPIGGGVGRGVGLASSQAALSVPMNLGSAGPMSGSGAFGATPAASDIVKRNVLGSDERTESGNLSQTLVSPLANRMLLQPGSKSNDGTGSGSADTAVVGEGAVTGVRVFSSSGVTGTQWRPPNLNSFQNEPGQVRGRTEITPDQREKYIQRLQKVKQHPSNILASAHLSGSNQQFQAQQQNSLLQQFNSQSLPTQIGPGQSPILANAKPPSQQQLSNSVHPQMAQQASFSTGPRDSDVGHTKAEVQVQVEPSEGFNVDPLLSSEPNMAVASDDDLKSPFMAETSASLTENNQMPRDTDFSPGQPLPSNANLGVIGRRSISDLGAIGDNISGSVGNQGVLHDQVYNLQMLDAAFHKLPQPKDSERVKNYIPRRPAVTPSSYPQVQAPIVDNPAFWERLSVDTMGTDTLFFAFYYQQNTYQQYLAAKELKRQSWRYHRKFHTWFQRHEEPKITTDDYEQGTYVYFDFHIGDDNMQHGWCQRIKTDFTFEYSYLEDELVV